MCRPHAVGIPIPDSGWTAILRFFSKNSELLPEIIEDIRHAIFMI